MSVIEKGYGRVSPYAYDRESPFLRVSVPLCLKQRGPTAVFRINRLVDLRSVGALDRRMKNLIYYTDT